MGLKLNSTSKTKGTKNMCGARLRLWHFQELVTSLEGTAVDMSIHCAPSPSSLHSSITPEVTSASGSGAQGKSAVPSCEPVVVEVDPSLPTTILQIRLADGTKYIF